MPYCPSASWLQFLHLPPSRPTPKPHSGGRIRCDASHPPRQVQSACPWHKSLIRWYHGRVDAPHEPDSSDGFCGSSRRARSSH